mgnify:FL=1
MARFYGVVKGQAKTRATRRGSSSSGLTVWAASWKGAVEVDLYVDGAGRDCFRVSLVSWHGAGRSEHLAKGAFE